MVGPNIQGMFGTLYKYLDRQYRYDLMMISMIDMMIRGEQVLATEFRSEKNPWGENVRKNPFKIGIQFRGFLCRFFPNFGANVELFSKIVVKE